MTKKAQRRHARTALHVADVLVVLGEIFDATVTV